MSEVQEAQEAFRGQGRNFMTPNIITHGIGRDPRTDRKVAWELSSGSGIERDTILYGVTCMVREGNEWHPSWRIEMRDDVDEEHKLSRCFHSEDEAREYISTLQ